MHYEHHTVAALLLVLWTVGAAAAAGAPAAAGPSWLQPFTPRNNVTVDSSGSTVALAGATKSSGSLAPSAALISNQLYDGNIQINITVSDWQILQSGYQAQVSLFLAPQNYTLSDYLSWPETDAIGAKQHAYVRSKIYTQQIPDYTWSSVVVPSSGSSRSIGVAGAWRQTGVISLKRTAGQVSGFLKVGSSQFVTFPPLDVPAGPVLLGVQVLYGYTYSVTISNISITADTITPIPSPPPAVPAGPAAPVLRVGGSEASWRSLFATRNGVSFDNTTGAATLAGSNPARGSLSPSAGLLSKIVFVGDFEINVTINDWQILQPGYQAEVNLFMAPVSFQLGDYLTWPDTDALNSQELAYTRTKIYTTDIPNYSWSRLYVAGNGTQQISTAGSWQQQGVLSLSRKGSLMSGFLQVGSSAVLAYPPLTTNATGPVVLGLQMLYGYNYSATVSQVSVSYTSYTDLPTSTLQASGAESSWRSLFFTRNGVSFDTTTGAATLAASNPAPGTLSPSAALLTRVGFDGDFQINVTVADYKILQSGYQAEVNLFMAPVSFQLGDYLTWPDTDALNSQELAYTRTKIYTTDIPNYSWSRLYVAGNGTQQVSTAGSWQQQGVLSLSRKGSLMSGFLQVGSSAVLTYPPLTTNATGPVVLGLQMLYGYNYSATVSQVSINYRGATVPVPAPPPPPPVAASPSPPPSPQPPSPPPTCNITALDGPPAVYSYGSRTYEPKGVGGGGAMSCFSMSPYTDLWLLGTDMGSLYRSTNRGTTWEPISHTQMRMTTDMPFAPPVGFSADGVTLFFAPCWNPSSSMPCVAKRSTDAGVTWSFMDVNANKSTVFNQPSMPPNNKRPIRYWVCSSQVAELCYAATTGGLDRTTDKGLTWQPVSHPALTGFDSQGSMLDGSTMYHATPAGIFKWLDGQTDNVTTVLSGAVHSFAAGRDASGLTLAYIDKDSSYCDQAMANVSWSSSDARNATLSTCGRLWVSVDGGATFSATPHFAYKVVMAENNGQVVYSHPSRTWDKAYGTRVYKSVITRGSSGTAPSVATTKVFDQVDVDNGYALWPADKLDYSAVGLDVGYWDGGYYLFAVHPRDASIAGGSENFFLHVTRDGGGHWQSPFTRYRDCGPRSAGKRWSSTGLEPTNFYKVAMHPTAPRYIYAGAADIKGIVSEDGGDSWRVIDPKRQAVRNSIYAFAFDPALPRRVFVATAKWHDYPSSWYANPLNGAGGIFVSDDAGLTFSRVGGTASTNPPDPQSTDMNNDFLAVAYDAGGGYLYAGGHINGIARIRLGNESSWTWLTNAGLTGPDLWQNETIVPNIQVDPDNGDVYCLLTGNRAVGSPRNMANQARTGIYRMPRGGTTWTLLRGTVVQPPKTTDKPWQYPTAFAIDWTSGTPGNRTRMLLADFINNAQAPGTAGVWSSSDGGGTWTLRQQADWPTDVLFDPSNPRRAYLGGARSIGPWGVSAPGSWGYGGFMYSDDAGETWTADETHPFQASINSVAADGTDRCKLWYATAGTGLMIGPAPPGLTGC